MAYNQTYTSKLYVNLMKKNVKLKLLVVSGCIVPNPILQDGLSVTINKVGCSSRMLNIGSILSIHCIDLLILLTSNIYN